MALIVLSMKGRIQVAHERNLDFVEKINVKAILDNSAEVQFLCNCTRKAEL